MLSRPLFRKRFLTDRKKLGRWGEKYCENFLKKQGYKFIARNFTHKKGEIDLIFISPTPALPVLVFVEVKTRRREKRYKAQDSVGYKKRRKIIYTANHFIRRYKIKDKPIRFDIAAVILPPKGPPQIRHYKNAFVP